MGGGIKKKERIASLASFDECCLFTRRDGVQKRIQLQNVARSLGDF